MARPRGYQSRTSWRSRSFVLENLERRYVLAAPVAADDVYNAVEDELLTVDVAAGVLANDTDADGDQLNAALTQDPQHGQLTLDVDGSFTYQPNADFFGTDSFQYSAGDGPFFSPPATVLIVVGPTNDSPVAAGELYRGLFGQPLAVNNVEGVLANDVDVDHDVLSVQVVDGPESGQLVLAPDGSFVYEPNLPAPGSDRFSYLVSDGATTSDTVSVELFFTDDVYSTPKATPLDTGLANGTFETGDFTGWTTFTNPGGTLGGAGFPDVVPFDTNNDTIDTRSAQFLPGTGGGGIQQTVWLRGGEVRVAADVAVRSPVTADEAGRFELLLDGVVVDSHDFGTVTAGREEYHELTATISGVTTGPHDLRVVSIRDSGSSFGSSPVTYVDNVQVFGEAFGVLSNDQDSNITQLGTMLLTPPQNGTLELRDDGSFRYVPDSAFTGEDSFVYKTVQPDEGVTLYSVDTRSDKLLKIDSESGQIEIVGAIGHDMESVDLAFNDGVLYAMNQQGQSTFELLTINPVTGQMESLTRLRFRTALRTTKGITAANGNLYVIFSHVAGYCGNGCGSAHVLGTVNPESGNITEVVNFRNLDGGFNHNWNALATDIAGEIIAHRMASDEHIQTHRLDVRPLGLRDIGGIELANVDVNDATAAGTRHFILNPKVDGIYRFDPDVGYSKILETIRLGPLGRVMSGLAFGPEFEVNSSTVTIVVPEDGAPSALDDDYQVDEDSELSVTAADGVLANDVGQPGALQAVITRGPVGGRIQSDPDGAFQYIPAPDFNGVDYFQYQAVDEDGQSNVATVRVSVRATPDTPEVVDDNYVAFAARTMLATPESGVLANDRDGDGDTLTVSLVQDAAHGHLTLSQDGSFLYSPEAGFLGTDSFMYQVSDGQSDSEVATVTIDVQTSPPPVAASDTYAVQEDETLDAVSVLANDVDPDGDDMTALLDFDASHGALTLNADGTFLYVPDENFFGVDTFGYRASDGTSQSESQTVLISVTSVNDPPIAEDDQYDVPIGGDVSIAAADGVLANDRDLESILLTAILEDGPQFGTLTLEADGSFQYLAGDSFVISDRFTYRASDDQDPSDVTTVTLRADIPMIDVGHHTLKANTADQKIEILVTGGQAVSGADLFVMVGDGGPELIDLGLPAGTGGPVISAIDLKADTIFAAIPDRPVDLGSLPQVANWSVSATGGSVVAADGLLVTLTIDTTGWVEGEWDLRLGGILPDHPFGPFDTSFAGVPAFVANGSITVRPTEVLARHVFYNDSAWDSNDAGAGVSDDAAIATDKVALLPGETATFANYTSYSKGINGVLMDVIRLPDATQLTLDAFEFRVGRSSDLAVWQVAPQPELLVRPGAGVSGSDRLTLVWPDNAIGQEWLEIRLKSGDATLLPRDDVFYFGNAIGEVGDTAGRTLVTSTDVIAARDHQQGPFDMATVRNVYDFNRDRLVSSVDVILARDHQVGPLTALPLISPSTGAAAIPVRAGDANADGVFDSSDLVQVFQYGEFEDGIRHNSTWREGDWNGDREFDSSDLVLAFQRGHFEPARFAAATAASLASRSVASAVGLATGVSAAQAGESAPARRVEPAKPLRVGLYDDALLVRDSLFESLGDRDNQPLSLGQTDDADDGEKNSINDWSAWN